MYTPCYEVRTKSDMAVMLKFAEIVTTRTPSYKLKKAPPPPLREGPNSDKFINSRYWELESTRVLGL